MHLRYCLQRCSELTTGSLASILGPAACGGEEFALPLDQLAQDLEDVRDAAFALTRSSR